MQRNLTKRGQFAGAMLLLCLLSLIAQAATVPDLSGSWKQNREQSDDARAKMREAMGGGFPGGGPPMGGGGMGPMNPPENLIVTQQDAALTVNGRTLHTDGRKQEQDGPRGKVELSAQWEGERLVSLTQMGQEMKITESYERSGDQLVVTTVMENARFGKTISLRRVYDRASQ